MYHVNMYIFLIQEIQTLQGRHVRETMTIQTHLSDKTAVAKQMFMTKLTSMMSRKKKKRTRIRNFQKVYMIQPSSVGPI